MNKMGFGAIALSAALLLGLAFANSMNQNNRIPGNSLLANSTTNSIVTIGHRSALVTCSVKPSTFTVNTPVRCGNWSVTLLSTSNSVDNLSTASFSIGRVEANGTVMPLGWPFGSLEVLSGVSGRVCMRTQPVMDEQGDDNAQMSDNAPGQGAWDDNEMPDMGVGIGHDCLFISLSSASGNGSAVVRLVGLSFIRPHPEPEPMNGPFVGNGIDQIRDD
jgi:hypothetical protein